MSKGTKKGLNALRVEIEEQVPWIDIKPYSHNIIGLLLSQIAEEYGKKAANKAIRDFGLDKKGWAEE